MALVNIALFLFILPDDRILSFSSASTCVLNSSQFAFLKLNFLLDALVKLHAPVVIVVSVGKWSLLWRSSSV